MAPIVRKMKSLLAAVHKRLFRLKFALRGRRWAAAEGSRPAGKRVIVSGFFNEALGIGRAGALTLHALKEAGYEVASEDLRPFDRGLLTSAPASFSMAKGADIWLIHANAPEAEIALFSHDYDAWKHLYRIGYWAWESDLAPVSWISVARWFHEIWVPSRFVADALIRAGLPAAKLRVVPHAVPVPPQVETRFERGCVRVLTLFDPRSGFDRKNPQGAIDTWLEAFFEPGDGAELIVKSLAGAENYPLFKALQDRAVGRSDIIFLAETLDDDAQARLLNSCDILLSLHRGEGYGLPLAEAMARGLPVIATGWSGNLDFMTDNNSILIPSHRVPASIMYNGPDAQWAEPDVKAAAKVLAGLIHDAARRHALGDQARADMRKAYDNSIVGIAATTAD